MPTKNEIKFIASLRQKKNRDDAGVFVAEGEKLVRHFLRCGLEVKYLFCTRDGLEDTGAELVSAADMKRLSALRTPSPVLAVLKKPVRSERRLHAPFLLVLDGVRDPGNMGTILRLCDWFGATQIACTDDCVDVYNEKVVQASMGAVSAVDVFAFDRQALVAALKDASYTVVSTAMTGDSVYTTRFEERTALVLGNEGQGVSAALSQAANSHISIPPAASAQAESLNVAMSAAVCLSEWARGGNT